MSDRIIKVDTPSGFVYMGVRTKQSERWGGRSRKHAVYSDKGNLSARNWGAVLWVAENSPNSVRRALLSALTRMFSDRSPEEIWGVARPLRTEDYNEDYGQGKISWDDITASKAYSLLRDLAANAALSDTSPQPSSGVQARFQRDGDILIPTPRGDVLLGVRRRRAGHDVYSDTGNLSAKSWYAVEYVVDHSPNDVLVALRDALRRMFGEDATRVSGYPGDVYRRLVAKLAATPTTAFTVLGKIGGRVVFDRAKIGAFDISLVPGGVQYPTEEELAGEQASGGDTGSAPNATDGDAEGDGVPEDLVISEEYGYEDLGEGSGSGTPTKGPGLGVIAAIAALGVGFLLFRE